MKYQKNKKYNRPKRLTKEEKFGWILTSVIFTFFFTLYIAQGFIFNCIFEWPIRWDVKICFTEQINPAKERAAEKAVNFMP